MVVETGGTGNPMVGRRVFLRPVLPEDDFFLNEIASHPQTGAIWRWRGIPRSGDPIQSLWPDTLAAFVVTSKRSGAPVALAVARGADLLSRTCTFTYVARPELVTTGWHLEGAVLFLNYLFRVWDMRKVCGDSLSHNVSIYDVGIARGLVHEEGRLRDHVLMDGAYYDMVNLVIYRDEWMAATTPLLRRMTGSTGAFVSPIVRDNG